MSIRKLLLILGVFTASLFSSRAADYYWVNGSGYWTDINHWATTSGGSVLYSQVPGPADNVFFDDNSVSTNDTVMVTADIFMRNLSSVNLSKKAYLMLTAAYTVNIYGSLHLGDFLSTERFNSCTWKFVAGTGSFDIRSKVKLYNVVFDGSGSWNIKDSLETANFDIYSGTLNFDTCFFEVYHIIFRGTQAKNIIYRQATLLCDYFSVSQGVSGVSGSSTNSKLKVKNVVGSFQVARIEVPDVYMEPNLPHSITGNISTRKLVLENSPFNLGNTIPGGELIVDTLYLKGTNIIKLTGLPNKLTIKGTIVNYSNNCWDRSAFIANNVTTRSTINNLSGTAITTSNLVMQGIEISGTDPLVCQQCVNGGNNNNVSFPNPALGRGYYWIGGKGEWQDPGHWSLNSGGVAVNCIPGMTDTIIFDNNSGLSANDSVMVTADFVSGSWVNNCSTPFVIVGPNFNGTLSGSLIFNYPIVGVQLKGLYFKGDSGVHHIKSSGTVFSSSISFDGYKADYYLQDSLNIYKDIEIVSAGFYSQGQLIRANYFRVNSNWSTVDISGSTFYVYTFMVDYKGVGSILETVNTYIFFSNQFYCRSNGFTFWHVENTAYGLPTNLFSGGSNFKFVKLFGNVHVFGITTIDTLILEKNSMVNIVISVTVTSRFSADGDCNNWIHIYNNQAKPTLNVSTGAQVVMNYCMVNRVVVYGVSAYQSNSICLFDCNVSYTPPAGRTLYWVGGTGNWSDLNRWSNSSGGMSGVSCIPGPSDTIIIDHNSVSTYDTIWFDKMIGGCASIKFQSTDSFFFVPKLSGARLVVTDLVLVNSKFISNQTLELFLATKKTSSKFEGIWDGYSFMNIKIEGTGKWTFKGKLWINYLGKLEIRSVDVSFDTIDLKTMIFQVDNPYNKPANVTFNHSNVHLNSYLFNAGNVYQNSGSITFTYQFSSNNSNSAIYSRIIAKTPKIGSNYSFTINFPNQVKYLEIDGVLKVNSGINADTLVIYPGSIIRRAAGYAFSISKKFKAIGLSCNLITIESLTTGTQCNWFVNSAVIQADFVQMRDQNAFNPGNNYIGKNSQDISNNSGWIFGNNKDLIYGLGEDTAICGNIALALNSPNNYLGATYLWSTGETSSSIQVDSSGSYWLEAYYDGTCIVRDTITVNSGSLPKNLVVSDTILCGFDSVQVYAPKADTLNYEWDDLSSDTLRYINAPGTYRLRTYAPGCERSDTFRIVSQNVEATSNFPLADTSVCSGFSWTANVQANKADSILWSTGESGSAIQILDSGVYWYRAKNGYCESTDTVRLILSEPLVEAPSDTTICGGSGVKLFPLASKGDVSWETFGTGDNSCKRSRIVHYKSNSRLLFYVGFCYGKSN